MFEGRELDEPLPAEWDQALEDLWWAQHGIPPHEVDDWPARRAAYLKRVWVLADEVAHEHSPQAKAADQQRLLEAKRKAGQT